MNTLTDQYQLVKASTLDANFIQTLLSRTINYNDGFCRELFRDGRHLKSLRSLNDTFSARKGDMMLSVNMGIQTVTFSDKLQTHDGYFITYQGTARVFVLDPRTFAMRYLQGIDPLQKTVDGIMAALRREAAQGTHDDLSVEYLRHVVEYDTGMRQPIQTQQGLIEVTPVIEYGVAIWDAPTVSLHVDPKRNAEIDDSKHAERVVEKGEVRIEREQADLHFKDELAQRQREIDERQHDEALADDRAKWQEAQYQEEQKRLRDAAVDIRIEQARSTAEADARLLNQLRSQGYSTANILQEYPELRYQFERRDLVAGALLNGNELLRLNAADSISAAPASTDSTPEDVLFSAFHPGEVPVDTWATLVIYAHTSASSALVASDLRQLRTDIGDAPRSAIAPAIVGIPRGTHLTFVPRFAGVQFNPETITVKWLEDLHRVAFRFLPGNELADSAGNGELMVFASSTMGLLPIAKLKLAMLFSKSPLASIMGAPAQGRESARSIGRVYHQIFASYSHEDKDIVQEFGSVYKILGISVLADYESLLSGQTFATELMRLIESADAFQLFWSKRSAVSDWVHREWEHALSCNRDGFILPVYWETPMPTPPPELAHLHFAPLQVHKQTAHGPRNGFFARLLGRSTHLEV